MMTKKLSALAASLAAVLTLSAGAQAAVMTNAPAGAQDFSSAGLVAFNLDTTNFAPTTLNFRLEAGDLTGPLSLNALIGNLTGVPYDRFSFTLEGISFTAAGSVTPSFGSLGTVDFTPSTAKIVFGAWEPAGFEFGNPFGDAGKFDWILNTAGLSAGDTFSLRAESFSAEVPEPGSFALLVPGLALLGAMRARRKRN